MVRIPSRNLCTDNRLPILSLKTIQPHDPKTDEAVC